MGGVVARAANSLTTSHLDKWRQDTPFRLLGAATDLPTEPARDCVIKTHVTWPFVAESGAFLTLAHPTKHNKH